MDREMEKFLSEVMEYLENLSDEKKAIIEPALQKILQMVFVHWKRKNVKM